ncbi:MAG: hypothetical protein ABSC56_04880 [Solirubrobacteraceae bacterium]
MLDAHAGVCLSEGLLGSRNLRLHPCPLGAKGIRRYVVAFLGMHPQQPLLLGGQFVDERCLGFLHLPQRALAELGKRPNGLLTALDSLDGHLDRPCPVVPSDGVLDQLGSNADLLRASWPPDPTEAEVVRIPAPVPALAQAVAEASATGAKNAATQIVALGLRSLTGKALLVESHLHALERLPVDQRLMPSIEDFLVRRPRLVDDVAAVVAIAEQSVEHRRAQRCRFRPAPGRS